jgi:transcription initiation factor TFIID subunit TAF12
LSTLIVGKKNSSGTRVLEIVTKAETRKKVSLTIGLTLTAANHAMPQIPIKRKCSEKNPNGFHEPSAAEHNEFL